MCTQSHNLPCHSGPGGCFQVVVPYLLELQALELHMEDTKSHMLDAEPIGTDPMPSLALVAEPAMVHRKL